MITRRLTSAFIIALLISGVFTLWLSQKYNKAPRTPPPAPKRQYIAAAANMEAGQVIRAENLHLVDWPASVPLQGGFSTAQPLIGRMVMYPLAAGEPILERQLTAPGSGNAITVKIPDGMRAISLRTDEVVGVAGFLLPGTRVDVLVTLHPTNSPDVITSTVLQDVQVLATGQKAEPDPDGKPVTATVVTLLVSPKDAEKVDLASTQGTVHFVLRNGVDREDVKDTPVLFSQLSGVTPPSDKAPKLERPAPKPYTVRTFLGATEKTENF